MAIATDGSAISKDNNGSPVVLNTGGVIRTRQPGGGMTKGGFGPDDSSDTNQRSNCTFLEAFAISNATSNDITNAKLYIGNKWSLPTT